MLPNKVIYKGKEFETIGFIKLNNGSFLVLQNIKDIIYLDLSKINLKLELQFDIKEATKVELVLMDYIISEIKKDIDNGKYQNQDNLRKDLVQLNRYINLHPELLGNMKQLDFKDDIVTKTMSSLLSYFEDVINESPLKIISTTSLNVANMNGEKNNEISQDSINLIEDTKLDSSQEEDLSIKNSDKKEENIIDDSQSISALNTSIEEQIGESNNFIDNKDSNINYPLYDEEAITQILMANKLNSLNVIDFVNHYLHDFSIEQIEYLLNNYQFDIEYIDKLNEQKNIKSINQTKTKPLQNKVKILTLTNQSNAAFVDTLLLSFIVGLVSGMYLILLILIIMS